MEFGALICKPKEPMCLKCSLKNRCGYFRSDKKFKQQKRVKLKEKNYNIFCCIDKSKNKIALTKKHDLGFLNNFYLYRGLVKYYEAQKVKITSGAEPIDEANLNQLNEYIKILTTNF